MVSQSTLRLRQGLAQAKQDEKLVPLGGNPGSACFGQLGTCSVNQGTSSGQPNLSTPEIHLCSYLTPFWLVGSLYWCCQGFSSLAAGGLGLGEGRTWFKESRQQHPGIQMKSSSWVWLQHISCKLQAGQYCILPGFALL